MRRARCVAVLLAAAAALAPAARAATPWQAETGLSVEHLSNGRPDWTQLDVALRRRSPAGASSELAARWVERYGRSDSELAAGLAWPLSGDWTLALRATAANGRFLARVGAQATLSRRLGAGWVLGAGLGRNLYEPEGGVASGTSTARLDLERYVGDWRLAAGASRARLDGGEHANAVRLQLDRSFNERSRVGLLVAHGDELEHDPQGVLASRVGAVALLGRLALADGWALGIELSRTRVRDTVRRSGVAGAGAGYSRSGGRLALQREF
jgi:YaiO family outer membrane protein